MKTIRRTLWFVIVSAAMLGVTCCGNLLADEVATAPVSQNTIRQWVKELDADRYETRQRAEEALIKAGQAPDGGSAVIPPVMEAIAQGNLEVGMRGLDILKALLDSSAPETRVAAREALEKLATSDNKALSSKAAAIVQANGGASRRPPAAAAGPFGLGGGVIMGGGKLQINVGDGGGQFIEFQAVNGHGQRNIHARDNGRSINIKDDTEDGITMTITERVDGKDQTKTVTAKDAAELKRKDLAAFELYEKHAAGQLMGAMQNDKFVLGGGGLIILGPANEADAAKRTLGAFDAELQTLRATVGRLSAKADAGKIPPAHLKAYLMQIEALGKQMAELDKQVAR